MGGIVLVLSGDFRQTLPVIPKGTRADGIRACLKSSNIWHHTQTLVLSTNMRAQLFGDATSSQFAKDLLTLGDGKVPLDQNGELPISRICTIVNSEIELMRRVYPNIPEHYQQPNQGQNLGNY